MVLIAYYRVANARQARDSPGLEAQRSKVEQLRRRLLQRGKKVGEVVRELTEVESRSHRPQLTLAMDQARRSHHESVAVVVAQLYSLARDADFLQLLVEKAKWGQRCIGKKFLGFWFPDLPHHDTSVELLAELARFELEARGRPAREGLLAAKAKGAKLGGTRPGTARENSRSRAAAIDRAEQLRPLLAQMHAEGASLRVMAQAAAASGITTAKGEPLSASQIKRHLDRLDLLAR